MNILTRFITVLYDLTMILSYGIKCYFLLMPFVVFWYLAAAVALYDASLTTYFSAPRELIYNCLLISLAITSAAMVFRLFRGATGTRVATAEFSGSKSARSS